MASSKYRGSKSVLSVTPVTMETPQMSERTTPSSHHIAAPKRLIEVDLPIKRIGENVRATEKRFPTPRGHIATLHVWWARRPLGACRSVVCASLWPDPADPNCPSSFRVVVREELTQFAKSIVSDRNLAELVGQESWSKYVRYSKETDKDTPALLREMLLVFLGDFSSWKAGQNPRFLAMARRLTQSAHQVLSPQLGNSPVVADPFAGGGAIPLEALRVGAHTISSELNPVAVLLNRVALNYIPRFGSKLATDFEEYAKKVDEIAKRNLRAFYPPEHDGTEPIVYLWSRTIRCEGPACGTEVPLLRSLWLAKKGNIRYALKPVVDRDAKTIRFDLLADPRRDQIAEGTVRRSSATCPICGYTTAASNVREQFKGRHGGSDDSRLIAIAARDRKGNVTFRLPESRQLDAVHEARKTLSSLRGESIDGLPLVPDEKLPYLRSIFNIKLLGADYWADLFTSRQSLAILAYQKAISVACQTRQQPTEYDAAVRTCLALALDKVMDFNASLCQWRSTNLDVGHVFGRQALGIVWDFVETNLLAGEYVDWQRACSHVMKVIETIALSVSEPAEVLMASAASSPLPDDSVDAYITDPPYYDMVPYADLSDFFYVWLNRLLGKIHPDLFKDRLTPKKEEIVQLSERNPIYSYKTRENYENMMSRAMAECRRCLRPSGIAVVVFAHKSTSIWETQLQAMVNAGWVIVGSWPIDTEMGSRLRARNSAVLSSSIHLVCRPRENPDGSPNNSEVGDWREVLAELPERIHEWMPHLSKEGIVGADAIFACLGPALEVFTRYSHVEKASGERVGLREYLEHVWGAVSQEALQMVFEGADTGGFEEDARLTAMWLWTLSTSSEDYATSDSGEEVGEDEPAEEEGEGKKNAGGGYSLEFDTARKIAQGLGAHLESLESIVEVKGETARLLGVAERTRILFGKDQDEAQSGRKKGPKQLKLDFEMELEQAESSVGWKDRGGPQLGETTLDRVHQSMLLFAAGRSDALRRFLAEEGAGNDARFWKLAQALSALYPMGSGEKRWVDGVLARKKGLGY